MTAGKKYASDFQCGEKREVFFLGRNPVSYAAGRIKFYAVTLAAGIRLGPYEMIAPLGAGGMGEVWKARDTRLGRAVAIKVSKTEFSRRFEHEARAIAALNHPHICQIYDVGPNYIVMELI